MNSEEENEEYLKVLYVCGNIAYRESLRLNENIMSIEEEIKKFQGESKKNISKIDNLKLKELFQGINQSIFESVNLEMENIKNSYTKKKNSLNDFTITLFGRTKAGKSTLREAITHGDGNSIGKGDQRTTRDIKEYRWNNLRIIDTPGISAYEGEEDLKIAESIIDETDVVLFLVTNDSIQESEFHRLMDLKAKNKPIIVLLNVKLDLNRNIHMKKFLKNYNNIISREGQKGHIERIELFCKKYLQDIQVEIIPIHAMAAYRSTIEKDIGLKNELYKASGIENLKNTLKDIVINQGRQKRILTFRDDYIYFLNNLQNIFLENYESIQPEIICIRENYEKLKNLFKEIKKDSDDHIKKEFKKIFNDIKLEIDDFIDENAGKKDIEKLWNSKIKDLNLEQKINNIYIELCKQIEKKLTKFEKEFDFEIKNINFDKNLNDIKNIKKGYYGKITRWSSVCIDIALLIAPGGWITGVLALGGTVLTAISIFSDNDVDVFEKQKSNVKRDIKKDLDKSRDESINNFKKEFNKKVLNKIDKAINVDMPKEISTIENFMKSIDKNLIEINKKIKIENKNLFTEIYRTTFNKSLDSRLISIARIQGKITKVLIKNDEILSNKEKIEKLEKIINERIVYVEYTNELETLIKRAFYPAKIDNIKFEYDNEKIIIKTDEKSMKILAGEDNENIKLTKMLLYQYNIVLEKE